VKAEKEYWQKFIQIFVSTNIWQVSLTTCWNACLSLYEVCYPHVVLPKSRIYWKIL